MFSISDSSWCLNSLLARLNSAMNLPIWRASPGSLFGPTTTRASTKRKIISDMLLECMIPNHNARKLGQQLWLPFPGQGALGANARFATTCHRLAKAVILQIRAFLAGSGSPSCVSTVCYEGGG